MYSLKFKIVAPLGCVAIYGDRFEIERGEDWKPCDKICEARKGEEKLN